MVSPMNESQDDKFDLHDKRLSLIDVSFEDDCLFYSSPPPDFLPTPGKLEMLVEAHDDVQGVEQPSIHPLEETPPPETMEGATKNTGKYNLRKSLAWDSAFFTSAGVLEPEELSSMMCESEKGAKKPMLPGIEEDVYMSSDSISTLASLTSDNLTLETIEADLFSDVRASIQKSTAVPNAGNSGGKKGSGIRETHIVQSSEKANIVSQNKAKIKAAPKKPNVVMHGSGRVTKQIVNTSGDSGLPSCKPPKVAARVSPILTAAATKRVSLGASRTKVEKDDTKGSLGNSHDTKNSTSRGMKAPALGVSRSTLPKPKLPYKSSLGSTKADLRASSSFDSSGNLSSDSSDKSSINVKQKIDSRAGNRSSSGLTVKSTFKAATRTRNQSVKSHQLPHLKSVTRLSCSISPASSVSEWSSESFSPTSTKNKGLNSSRTSLNTTCKDSLGDGDIPQVSDPQIHSSGKCSGAHNTQLQGFLHENVKRVSAASSSLLRPDSIKPTGLRMPSPKIGFFDGVKSAVRTPNGSMQSNSALSGGLPRFEAGTVSPSGRSKEAKLGKFQPVRTVTGVRSTKVAAEQPALGKGSRSPLPLEEPSNTAPKIRSASRKEKSSPGIPLKVQNRMSSGSGGKSNLKAENTASKGHEVAANNLDIAFSEADGRLSILKGKTSRKKKEDTLINDSQGPGIVHNASPTSVIENKCLSQKMSEDSMSVSSSTKYDLHSHFSTNEKEKSCFEGHVDGLIKQVKAIDIHKEKKEHVDDDHKEVGCGGQEKYLKLSSPTSQSHIMRPTVE